MSATTATAPSDCDGETAAIVQAAIQRTNNIATLPEVTQKIVRLTNDPKSTLDDLQKIVSRDPALSARILRVVNSPFYGLPGQIASIDRAIVMLGLNAVKNIAIAASLDKVFRHGHISREFEARDLWTHSMTVAAGSFLLAEGPGCAFAGEAFLAGLMHDLGIMVELEAFPQQFSQLVEQAARDDELTFREAEQHWLGATHEQFGAALCRKWNFPACFEEAAGYHHHPLDLPLERRMLPALVHTADVLAAQLGIGYTRTVEAESLDPLVLSAANLSADDVEAVAEALPAAAQDAQKLLS